MNIIEQLQHEQSERIVVNQVLKQQLRQRLFVAHSDSQPAPKKSLLQSLRASWLLTFGSGLGLALIIGTLIIAPTHQVSAEAMLKIATQNMIPVLEPGQVFHVQTQHRNRQGQVDRTIDLWYDGKNIRSEEKNADGYHVVRLDLLQNNDYEYTHYEYDFRQNKIIQYTAPDMRLMAQSDYVPLPDNSTGDINVTFMMDPEVNEILFGNDLIDGFIAHANNEPSADVCAAESFDQPKPELLYPMQNTKIDFAGQEIIDGITYVKIKMVNYQNNAVTDIRQARNYHEFWIDQATGRMRQQRQVIHDEVREATYYSAGEVLRLEPDYFTLDHWQEDYAMTAVPINFVQPETQLESGDIMLMVEAQ